ncbi:MULTISPECIES: NAD-dependent epimerase/dehydratase family protein [Streptomyces]|uniref:NAD-dependent epimerase n=2 Tax=Streptomyces TaxID=1883 RepID=A0A100Y979_9ACTN|nr:MULTISPECIES: NAD-dependent epimerase/dehydratase family protein [Streptomyces]KUH39986.1 NAD-dependent epimerase [Streptomyces kanasensis]UUS29614.1 NAD-dependent epimerase/dehydratase family protein [Streptomyces changanensis]
MTAPQGKRIVVTGATGNVGTSVVTALTADDRVASVLGLARRRPDWSPPRTEWARADIEKDGDREFAELLAGADAVVHLAWAFQPTHDPLATWRTNVLGGMRVFRAVAEAGVPALVYASSVGAYSPGPKDRYVDESWPTHGWPEAAYSREKAYLERVLDGFEARHPEVRVVRLRPAFLFKEAAALEQLRIFAGPWVPGRLASPRFLPVVPDIEGLRFQALHTDDAADAYRRAALDDDARGAYNLAAEPPVGPEELAALLDARVVRLPRPAVRAALSAAWRLRLARSSPQLFDAFLRLPLMDASRARDELGWRPRYTALEAVGELLRGLRGGAGMPTAPLHGRGGR